MLPENAPVEALLDGVYPVVTSDKDFTLEGVESFLKALQIIHKDKVIDVMAR